MDNPLQALPPQSAPWTRSAASSYLKLVGWKTTGTLPDSPKNVLIAAPHSSNWDLPFMLAVAGVFRLKINWLGKHRLFEGPMGPMMRALGGIPVDRRARHGLVEQVMQRFNDSESMYLAVAPSGTRSGNTHWKSGFYHIARAANVPIVCAFLDYKKKLDSVGPAIVPSGDIKADMDRIREFYADIVGFDGRKTVGVQLSEELEKE